ncbi:MAG: hypothetical protein A2X66_01085 [Ignavibacteria bacterium GWA2_54_16]|nr:MAG: hypothetical protein A2X66_01085 [Ignavibacteria bacterium GWA2_54_16]
MRIVRGFVLLCMIAASWCTLAVAQSQTRGSGDLKSAAALTGNLRLDILSTLDQTARPERGRPLFQEINGKKKSPVLAGVMSLAIPGTGEFYTESYWRAAGFALAEAGLWMVYAVYTSKGNKQTDIFQAFADDHWSALRYAEWIEANVSKLNSDVTSFNGYLIPGTEGRPAWERVDWSKINAVESQIAQKSGNGFTHLLPHRPEQQYFELIGKYPQFAAGWDDAGVMTPERILSKDVSARFLEYSKMRGTANDFFNTATTGTALVVVNHVLSALDAAWSASQYNNRVKLEAHLQPTQRSYGFVEMVPTASLTYRF